MKEEKSKSRADLEWEQRILCIDESCIGVIGPDGRCKECGLPHEGGRALEDLKVSPDASAEETDAEFMEDGETEETIADDSEYEEAESLSDQEWEQRTLCSDEACIGVIGADGRCKECGLPFNSNL